MTRPGLQREKTIVPIVVSRSTLASYVEVPVVGHAEITTLEVEQLRNGDRSGFAALTHTVDGRVHMHVDPSLELDEDWFVNDPAYANLQRGGFHQTPISIATWHIADGGIDVDAAFTLPDGREMSCRARQDPGRDRGLRQFVPTQGLDEITMLRFLDASDFGMMRRRGSILEVVLDGAPLELAQFPFPLNGTWRYQARFAGSVAKTGINPAGVTKVGRPRDCALSWQFGETLPDLSDLTSAVSTTLTFATTQPGLEALENVTSATITCRPFEDGVEVRLLDVRQDWKPARSQLTLGALARLRKQKRRNLNIEWSGVFDPSRGEPTLLDSRWTVRSTTISNRKAS